MKRNKLGGKPYEFEKEGNIIILRFFPQPSANYPDDSTFVLRLNEKDKQTLIKILS
jgi:hypothetical protein